MERILETVALLGNISGVLLLFFFGMPFRIKSNEGRQSIDWVVSDEVDPKILAADRLYTRLGYLALVSIAASTIIQLFLVWCF